MYPLLLHLFRTKLQSIESSIGPAREFSDTTRALLRTCAESCKSMVGVLSVLQQQGLLGKSRSRWTRSRALHLANCLSSPARVGFAIRP